MSKAVGTCSEIAQLQTAFRILGVPSSRIPNTFVTCLDLCVFKCMLEGAAEQRCQCCPGLFAWSRQRGSSFGECKSKSLWNMILPKWNSTISTSGWHDHCCYCCYIVSWNARSFEACCFLMVPFHHSIKVIASHFLQHTCQNTSLPDVLFGWSPFHIQNNTSFHITETHGFPFALQKISVPLSHAKVHIFPHVSRSLPFIYRLSTRSPSLYLDFLVFPLWRWL